jgi:hypothetical protein
MANGFGLGKLEWGVNNPGLPTTVEEFEEILDMTPEFSNAHELFHSARHHPEGDHSLRAHMIACFEKWLVNIPCLCNAGHDRVTSFWAMFFHDIGKQATAKLKDTNLDGSVTHSYIKHESVGADIFSEKYAQYFWRVVPTHNGSFENSKNETEGIEYSIRQHMNFWRIAKHGKVEAMKNSPWFWLLAEVCLCDKMGFKDDEWSARLDFFGFEVKE